jgi:hypothetical protein
VAVGVGLVWVSIHVPSAAPALLTAAAALGVWVLVAAGPLGLLPLIGLDVHRRGLIVIAIGIGAAPLLTSDPLSLSALVPCLFAAALLLRVALIRVAPGAAPRARPAPVSRLAGRAAGGRIAAARPAIRAAGRHVGRMLVRKDGPTGD